MDDTPPFFLDDEALKIALELAMLLRLNLVSELHVARKQYLDGSIPAGFQRTTILGVDGWLPFEDRKIGVIQLGLEEDACREVSDVGHDRVYLTDRLGMPLIEVVTYPDMRTPQEAAAVGQIIRKLCRSTGKVRTGYGAGRQDVNVSVTGGTRIEVKGVPQISRIPHLVYNEALRQCSLLKIRDELNRRGVNKDTFSYTSADVTRVVARTNHDPIRMALAVGHRVGCVLLRGFAGLLREPTQEHTAFAKEFSDRVRVIACLTRLPNIVHSDTASESLSGRHWKDLRKKMDAGHGDAMILVWGSERDVHMACEEIAIRAREATVGIPNDTRQALWDGTNGFERVLPGAERMYPDTDLPPLAIEEPMRDEIMSRLPKYFWDREKQYKKMGLPLDTIGLLSISSRVTLFDRLVDELKVDPVFAAVVLVQRAIAWRRAGLPIASMPDDLIYSVFKLHADRQLSREGVQAMITHILRQPVSFQEQAMSTLPELTRELGFAPATESQIREAVQQVIEEHSTDSFPSDCQRFNYMMGTLMRKLFGRADGRLLAQYLSKETGLSNHNLMESEVRA